MDRISGRRALAPLPRRLHGSTPDCIISSSEVLHLRHPSRWPLALLLNQDDEPNAARVASNRFSIGVSWIRDCPHADPAPNPGHCKRLLWFMGVRGEPESDYFQYIKSALMSARRLAPSLVPYLIYSGPACAMTAWYELHGGHVLFHDLSFFSDLREENKGDVSGAYLRLDVPALVQTLTLSGDIDPNIVLYTDTDVMFLDDINSCSIVAPQLFAIGADDQKGSKSNTGVMFLNVKAFAPHVPEIIKHGKAKNWDFVAYDQGLLQDYVPHNNISHLPDEFNWKGFWDPLKVLIPPSSIGRDQSL